MNLHGINNALPLIIPNGEILESLIYDTNTTVETSEYEPHVCLIEGAHCCTVVTLGVIADNDGKPVPIERTYCVVLSDGPVPTYSLRLLAHRCF